MNFKNFEQTLKSFGFEVEWNSIEKLHLFEKEMKQYKENCIIEKCIYFYVHNEKRVRAKVIIRVIDEQLNNFEKEVLDFDEILMNNIPHQLYYKKITKDSKKVEVALLQKIKEKIIKEKNSRELLEKRVKYIIENI